MKYSISVSDTCVTVVFEGQLRAIDLIFMNQDPLYRESIAGKKVLFMDFSAISGSELTPADIQGLMLLGKLDSQKAKNLHLVILITFGETDAMQNLCEQIFGDSSWQVTLCTSRGEALKLL